MCTCTYIIVYTRIRLNMDSVYKHSRWSLRCIANSPMRTIVKLLKRIHGGKSK